jgi:uncharacterized protein (TIGR00369 family)
MSDSKDSALEAEIRRIFAEAPFVQSLGIELVDVGAGRCETQLQLAQRHLQHHGYVHAGVQATLADHSAGAAASTLVRPDEQVLSIEFKLNLLRRARGQRLLCRATVLKAGRTVTVVESEVYADDGAGQSLVSKAVVTLAVVPLAHVTPG